MARFIRQFSVLLWKNWLSRLRRPVLSLSEIIWPCLLFFILLGVRVQHSPLQRDNCYLEPRNLPSGGLYPFVQSLFCDVGSQCQSVSSAEAGDPAQKSRSSLSLTEDSGSNLLSLVEELGKEINVTMQQVFSLQSKMDELFGQSGAVAQLGLSTTDLDKMDNIINIIERIHNETYTWEILFNLPNLVKILLNEDFVSRGVSAMAEMLMNLKRLLESVEDLFSPTYENTYLVLDSTFNLTISAMDIMRNVVSHGMKLNLTLMDVLWNAEEARSILKNAFKLDPIMVEQLMNLSVPVLKFPVLLNMNEFRSHLLEVVEIPFFYQYYITSFLFHNIDTMTLFKQVFNRWVRTGLDEYLVTKFDQMLTALMKPLTINQDSDTASSTQQIIYLLSNFSQLIVQSENNASSVELQKYQDNLESLPQWPQLKSCLVKDKLYRDYITELFKFERDIYIFLKEVHSNLGVNDVDRIIMDVDILISEIKMIMTQNEIVTCKDIVLKIKGVLNLPEKPFLNDVLTSITCGQQLSDSWNITEYFPSSKRYVEAMLTNVHPEIPVTVADMYKGWWEVYAEYDSLRRFEAEFVSSLRENMTMTSEFWQNFAFNTFQQHLLWNLAFDIFDAQGSALERSDYWPGIEKYIRGICWVVENSNQHLAGNGSMCDKGDINWRSLFNETLIFIQNAQNDKDTWEQRLLNAVLKFLNYQNIIKLSADDMQILGQSFGEDSTAFGNIQGLQIVVKMILENINLWMSNYFNIDAKTSSIMNSLIELLQVNNANLLISKIKVLMNQWSKGLPSEFMEIFNILLSVLEKGVEDAIIISPFQDQVNKFKVTWANLQKMLLYNSTETVTKSLNFFWNFTSSVWFASTNPNVDYVDIAQMFLRYLNNLGLLSQEQLSSVVEAISTSKNISIVASSTQSLPHLQGMELQLLKVLETLAVENKTQLLKTFYNMIQAVLKTSNATELSSVVTAFRSNSEDIFSFLEQFSSDDIGKALETVAKIIGVFHNMSKEDLAENLLKLYLFAQSQIQENTTIAGPAQQKISETIAKLTEAFHNNTNNISCILLQALQSSSVPISDLWLQQYCSIHNTGRKIRSLNTGSNSLSSENLYSSLVEKMIISLTYTNRDTALSTLSCTADLFLLWMDIMKEVAVQMDLDFSVVSSLRTALMQMSEELNQTSECTDHFIMSNSIAALKIFLQNITSIDGFNLQNLYQVITNNLIILQQIMNSAFPIPIDNTKLFQLTEVMENMFSLFQADNINAWNSISKFLEALQPMWLLDGPQQEMFYSALHAFANLNPSTDVASIEIVFKEILSFYNSSVNMSQCVQNLNEFFSLMVKYENSSDQFPYKASVVLMKQLILSKNPNTGEKKWGALLQWLNTLMQNNLSDLSLSFLSNITKIPIYRLNISEVDKMMRKTEETIFQVLNLIERFNGSASSTYYYDIITLLEVMCPNSYPKKNESIQVLRMSIELAYNIFNNENMSHVLIEELMKQIQSLGDSGATTEVIFGKLSKFISENATFQKWYSPGFTDPQTFLFKDKHNMVSLLLSSLVQHFSSAPENQIILPENITDIIYNLTTTLQSVKDIYSINEQLEQMHADLARIIENVSGTEDMDAILTKLARILKYIPEVQTMTNSVHAMRLILLETGNENFLQTLTIIPNGIALIQNLTTMNVREALGATYLFALAHQPDGLKFNQGNQAELNEKVVRLIQVLSASTNSSLASQCLPVAVCSLLSEGTSNNISDPILKACNLEAKQNLSTALNLAAEIKQLFAGTAQGSAQVECFGSAVSAEVIQQVGCFLQQYEEWNTVFVNLSWIYGLECPVVIKLQEIWNNFSDVIVSTNEDDVNCSTISLRQVNKLLALIGNKTLTNKTSIEQMITFLSDVRDTVLLMNGNKSESVYNTLNIITGYFKNAVKDLPLDFKKDVSKLIYSVRSLISISGYENEDLKSVLNDLLDVLNANMNVIDLLESLSTDANKILTDTMMNPEMKELLPAVEKVINFLRNIKTGGFIDLDAVQLNASLNDVEEILERMQQLSNLTGENHLKLLNTIRYFLKRQNTSPGDIAMFIRSASLMCNISQLLKKQMDSNPSGFDVYQKFLPYIITVLSDENVNQSSNALQLLSDFVEEVYLQSDLQVEFQQILVNKAAAILNQLLPMNNKIPMNYTLVISNIWLEIIEIDFYRKVNDSEIRNKTLKLMKMLEEFLGGMQGYNPMKEAAAEAFKLVKLYLNFAEDLKGENIFTNLEAMCQFDWVNKYLSLNTMDPLYLKLLNLFLEKMYFINDIMCIQKGCGKEFGGQVIHAMTELYTFTADVSKIVEEISSTPVPEGCSNFVNYQKQIHTATVKAKQVLSNAMKNFTCRCDVTQSLYEQLYESLEAMCQFDSFSKHIQLTNGDLLQLKFQNLFSEKVYFVNDVVCAQKTCRGNIAGNVIHALTELLNFTTDVKEIIDETFSTPVLENCENYFNYLKQVQIASNQTGLAVSTAANNPNCKCDLTASLTNQLYERFKYAVGNLGSLSPNSSTMTVLENIGTFKDLHIESCVKNITTLQTQLQQISNFSLETIDALLKANITLTELILRALATADRCNEESLALMLAFPENVNISIVTTELCSLTHWDRHKVILTISRNIDVKCVTYKAFLPMMMTSEANDLMKSILEVFSDITSLASKSLQFMELVPKLLDSVSNMNLPSLFEFDENVQARSLGISPTKAREALFQGICKTKSTSLFGEGLAFSELPQIEELTEEDYIKYKIPTNTTPYCLEFYEDILKAPNGPLLWTFLKPLLLGEIPYAPNTPEILALMEKADGLLKTVEELKSYSEAWLEAASIFEVPENPMLSKLQEALQSSFVRNFIRSQLNTDVEQLLKALQDYENMKEMMINSPVAKQVTVLSHLMVNVSYCISTERFMPMESEEDLEKKVHDLMKDNTFLAGVLFDTDDIDGNNTSRSASSPLPSRLKYTIRTNILHSMPTDVLENPKWVSQPKSLPTDTIRYNLVFIPLQDMIERAIIEMQTGQDIFDPAVQVAAMPYPCHKNDRFLNNIGFFLPLLMMLAWLISMACVVRKLVFDKELRLEEYMKILGVKPLVHFLVWFLDSFIILVFSSALITIILKASTILPNSNGFIVFLYFLDFGASVISLGYLIAAFFSHANTAALSACLLYIITFFPYMVFVVVQNQISFSSQILICLLCTTAFSQGAYIITLFEGEGPGLQWDNMYEAAGGAENVSFAWICWMIVIDSAIYLILGWYLHNIFPGKYGTRRPWYFPFKGSYWMNLCNCAKRHDRKIGEGYWAQNLNNYNQQMNGKEDTLNYMNFPGKEAAATKLEIGVAVRSLTKVYKHSDKVAIKDLNLDFYKGEITALLGPNGAGKTTTMSMLTGLHQPTFGAVYVDGRNMNRDMSVIREELGVCLQHDVLFESLTVREHLLLFGKIKAPEWTKEKLLEEVNMALENAGICQYQHKLVGTLSGGTKRKLSLAISFIGGSTTVILDEPTSGIDPCSRRNIWDIILKHREGRTIIFTTHHLDEADILSDRIIILESGQLKCCGSPSYLKEQYGHGYSLIISKKSSAAESHESCDVGLVTSLVKEHIPQATLKENAFGELTYIIPTAEDKTAFENLLHALDENMENLYLSSYSISDTTLEEVFMKLLQNEERSAHYHNQDRESLKSESVSTENDNEALAEDPRVTGIRLTFKQMAALIIKRFHHTRRDWKGAVANLLLPVLFVILAMALFSVKPISSEYPSIRMSPDMYQDSDVTFFSSDEMDFQNLTAMLLKSMKINEPCTDQDSNRDNPVCFWNGPSKPENSVDKCNCDNGFQQCPATNTTVPYFRNNEGNLLYNLTGYDLEDYLIATEKTFGMKRLGGWSIGEEPPEELKGNNFTQDDINSLVKVWYNQRGFHAEPALLNQLNNLILWANLPPEANWRQYGIALYSHPYRGFLLNDDKILENLRQCGVAFCILLGFSILTASIGGYVVQDRITGQKRLQHISGLSCRLYWITNFLCDMINYLIPVVLCICVFAAFQFSAFTYRENLGATSLLLILFGFATMPWMYLLSRFFTSSDTAFITYTAINLVLGLCTILAAYLPRFLGLLSNNVHLLNIYSTLRWAFIIFPQFCLSFGLIELSYNQLKFDLTEDFGIDSYMSPFKMEYLGWVFVAITLEGCFFFLIRLLFQGQILHKLRFKDSMDGAKDDEDEDVKRECQRVLNGEASNDVIRIHNLKKSYHFLNKNVKAVRGITMGVPIGECFGLLGVNGAGKTSTFKILTGDIGPSSGHATIRTLAGTEQDIVGSSIDGTLIGYCPQYDALDDLLTGWEHLYYYARIRGTPEKMIKKTIHDLAQRLHLTFHVNEVVKSYSGGTKRKLSTALALIGRPQVLLLDEPSSGMDPESKRFLWKAILSEVEAGCAAVLTSHSMEECEALCTRLAIMVNGKFRCIGSPKHIKNRFGPVYSVKVALSQKSTNSVELTDLLMSHFPGTMLKEEHQYSLEYQVPKKEGDLAKMFQFLENNKEQLNIKHYSISQATLDQVFINFARQLEESPDRASAEVERRNPSV